MGRHEGTDGFLGRHEGRGLSMGPEPLRLLSLDKCLVQTANRDLTPRFEIQVSRRTRFTRRALLATGATPPRRPQTSVP